jgi:hypothetical protein
MWIQDPGWKNSDPGFGINPIRNTAFLPVIGGFELCQNDEKLIFELPTFVSIAHIFIATFTLLGRQEVLLNCLLLSSAKLSSCTLFSRVIIERP